MRRPKRAFIAIEYLSALSCHLAGYILFGEVGASPSHRPSSASPGARASPIAEPGEMRPRRCAASWPIEERIAPALRFWWRTAAHAEARRPACRKMASKASGASKHQKRRRSGRNVIKPIGAHRPGALPRRRRAGMSRRLRTPDAAARGVSAHGA